MTVAIDTATERASVVYENKIVAFRELDFGFMHAKSLMPTLDELIKDPQSIKRIAVGIGPGSYTGIRVGVACAKAISYALKIPIVGVSSLQNFCPEDDFEGSFLAAIDAKTGGVYVAQGVMQNGKAHFVQKDEIVTFENFVQMLQSVRCLVTPHFAPLKQKLGSIQIEVIERYPSATLFIANANKAFEDAKSKRLEISYLRGKWS